MKLWYSTPRIMLQGYAAASLVCAAAVLFLAAQKGAEFLALSFAFYFVTAVLSWFWPQLAAPGIAALATLGGWLQSSFSGYDVQVSAGVLCIGVGVALLRMSRGRREALHLVHFLLLALAVMAVVSAVFTLVRVTSFSVAPGFAYQNYAVNAAGLPSDDLIFQVINRAINIFSWFGLLLVAQRFPFSKRGILLAVVSLVLVLNASVMLVQQFHDLDFMAPVGSGVHQDRLSGVTSFSYALGAAAEAMFILLPLWFVAGRRRFALSAMAVLLLLLAAYTSGSRTALFVILGTSVLWLLHFLNEKFRHIGLNRRIAILVSVALVILIVAVWVYGVVPAEDTSSLGRLKLYIEKDGGLVEHIVRTRMHQYATYLDMLARYPVAGIGIGSHYAVVEPYTAIHMPEFQATDSYAMKSNVSNTYLGFGVEMGLPALAAFSAIMILLLFLHSRSGAEPGPRTNVLLRLGLFIYTLGLVLGPQIYNPEAAGWLWLLAGAIVASADPDKTNKSPATKSRLLVIVLCVACGLVYVMGQFVALQGLDPQAQWRALRWYLDIGWYPQEEAGRWSGPEAAMTIEPGKLVDVAWRAGAPGTDYKATVAFYMDGKPVLETDASAGRQRRSLLIAPDGITRAHMLAVRVNTPMVPDELGLGDDSRSLGVFIESIRVLDRLDECVGCFSWETDKSERQFRWAQPEAWIPLSRLNKYSFSMRGLPTQPGAGPLRVQLLINDIEFKIIELAESWQEVAFTADELPVSAATAGQHELILHLRALNIEDLKAPPANETRNIAFAITAIE